MINESFDFTQVALFLLEARGFQEPSHDLIWAISELIGVLHSTLEKLHAVVEHAMCVEETQGQNIYQH